MTTRTRSSIQWRWRWEECATCLHLVTWRIGILKLERGGARPQGSTCPLLPPVQCRSSIRSWKLWKLKFLLFAKCRSTTMMPTAERRRRRQPIMSVRTQLNWQPAGSKDGETLCHMHVALPSSASWWMECLTRFVIARRWDVVCSRTRFHSAANFAELNHY